MPKKPVAKPRKAITTSDEDKPAKKRKPAAKKAKKPKFLTFQEIQEQIAEAHDRNFPDYENRPVVKTIEIEEPKSRGNWLFEKLDAFVRWLSY